MKRKISSATKEKLRRLRQRYHLGEFRKNKTKVVSMAKKKGGFRKRYRKVKRRSESMFGSGVMGKAAGVLGYLVYEAFISPMIPLSGLVKDLAELVLGIFLAKKGGILGSIGKAAIIINLYELLKAYVAPMFGIGGNGVSSSGSWWESAVN